MGNGHLDWYFRAIQLDIRHRFRSGWHSRVYSVFSGRLQGRNWLGPNFRAFRFWYCQIGFWSPFFTVVFSSALGFLKQSILDCTTRPLYIPGLGFWMAETLEGGFWTSFTIFLCLTVCCVRKAWLNVLRGRISTSFGLRSNILCLPSCSRRVLKIILRLKRCRSKYHFLFW